MESPVSLEAATDSLRAGRLDEAERRLRSLLAREPRNANALFQLGMLCLLRGNAGAAEPLLRQAADEAPSATAAIAHADALERLGRLEQACERLRLAIGRDSRRAAAWARLAAIELRLRRWSDAEQAARAALALGPADPGPQLHLAKALGEQGDYAAAEALLRKLLEDHPDCADGFYSLGVVLARRGLWSGALAAYEGAMRLAPDKADPRIGMADAWLRTGERAKAVEILHEAARLDPARAPQIESEALFAMQYGDEFARADVFEAHVRWGRRHASLEPPPARPPRSRRPRIRIGYVSPRFQRSSMAFALLPVLQNHDRARFEIHAFAQLEAPDAWTQRLRAHVDRWHEIQSLDDAATAALVREEGIDILVDLAGHTPGNRLRLFAQRPAPLAVSWLDYFDTTGVEAIDALLADDASLAPPHTQRFVETPVSLGPVRYGYVAPDYAPPVRPMEPRGGVSATFGCFARRAKITEATLDAWTRLLHRVPGSRLRLKNDSLGDARIAERLSQAFAGRGVDEGRLELRGASNHDRMLHELGEVDVVLDTFPYNGGITTLEALWMGRPVVTRRGETIVGRQGASFLAAIGASEWIAEDWEGYIERAARLASDRERLAKISAGLRNRVAASPIADSKGFTRRLESTLERLLQERSPA